MRLKNSFLWLSIICGLLVLSFILFPLLRLVSGPSPERMSEAIHDINVRRAIWLSIYTAGLAALISLLLGTPLAYLLARRQFPGKSLLESIIDLPIVIPHPVVGIAILGVVGKNFWLGRLLHEIGIRMMGSVTGIVTVLVFVSIPSISTRPRTVLRAFLRAWRMSPDPWGLLFRHLFSNHPSSRFPEHF